MHLSFTLHFGHLPIHYCVIGRCQNDDQARAFKKALIERALGAEMSHHLGYVAGADKPPAATNHRNGKSGKTLLTDEGPLRIEVPRDREATFEPS